MANMVCCLKAVGICIVYLLKALDTCIYYKPQIIVVTKSLRYMYLRKALDTCISYKLLVPGHIILNGKLFRYTLHTRNF